MCVRVQGGGGGGGGGVSVGDCEVQCVSQMIKGDMGKQTVTIQYIN